MVNGSLSKTAVNGAAGARSQASGLVVAVLVVLTLLLLTGLFENLPEATLAAVVIAAVLELIDFPAPAGCYRVWTRRLGALYGPAARALAELAAALAADGIGLRVARDVGQARDVLRRLAEQGVALEVYPTVDDALRAG